MKSQLRVLLVEENEERYVLAREILSQIKDCKFKLDRVSTFSAAVEAAKGREYDVYLLSRRIGRRSAMELLQEFHQKGCSAPVIMLREQGYEEALHEAGKELRGSGEKVKGIHSLRHSIRYGVRYRKSLDAMHKDEVRFWVRFWESAPGMAITNADGKIVEASRSLAEMLSYTNQELRNQDLLRFAHPDEMEKGAKLYRELISEERDYFRMEARFLRKGGDRIWIDLTVSSLRGPAGSPGFGLSMFEDITGRKRADEALRASKKQALFLSSRLLTTQEMERKLISQELHDSIGASLAAVKYCLERDVEECGKTSSRAIPMVQNAIEEVRRISKSLWPQILDDLGLLPAISSYCGQFEDTYAGISLEKQIAVGEDDVPEHLKVVIYRILQEALTNVAKHSRADRVNLCLRKNKGTLEFSVEDNGRGFNPDFDDDFSGGMGLFGMKDRTEISGGAFNIVSRPGAGTTLYASWPCA